LAQRVSFDRTWEFSIWPCSNFHDARRSTAGTWSSLSLQTRTLRPASIIPCCWDQLSRVWLFMSTGIFQ